MADIKALAEQLVNLTVKEVKDLSDVLKSEYGIEAAAAAPVMVAGGAAPEAEEKEEQTSFDITLKAVGKKKLSVIKVIRALTGLGLKDAKAIADEVPSTIKEGVDKAEAESIKKQLEEAGGEVELK